MAAGTYKVAMFISGKRDIPLWEMKNNCVFTIAFMISLLIPGLKREMANRADKGSRHEIAVFVNVLDCLCILEYGRKERHSVRELKLLYSLSWLSLNLIIHCGCRPQLKHII